MSNTTKGITYYQAIKKDNIFYAKELYLTTDTHTFRLDLYISKDKMTIKIQDTLAIDEDEQDFFPDVDFMLTIENIKNNTYEINARKTSDYAIQRELN